MSHAARWTWRPVSDAVAARVLAALHPASNVERKPAPARPTPTRKVPTVNKPSKLRRLRRWMRSASGQKATHLAPVVAVALVALYVSYGHIRHVALAHGYGEIGADLLPLSVDGMVIAAARYITRARTIMGRVCALSAFVLGVGATLAGNLLASEHDLIGRGTAVWPAVAVVGTGAVLHWGEARPRRKRQPAAKATTRRAPKTVAR